MTEINPDVVSSSLKRAEFEEDLELIEEEREISKGDVVVVEVVSEGGTYDKVEEIGGKTLELEEGMTIAGVLCERKAVKGFVGKMPEKVASGDVLDFIGGGGAVGKCVSSFEELGDPYPVEVKGLVRNGDEVLNVQDFSVDMDTELNGCEPLVMVSGTRMDSGKTTLAANIIEEISDRGYSVGAAKLTGFTRQRDRLKMKRHGAEVSMDFVDAGLLSSSNGTEEVICAAKGVLNHVSNTGVDVIVVELGGGIIGYDNVYEVLTEEEIVDNVCYNAVTVMDPVAAVGAKRMLGEKGVNVDVFSGPATDTDTGENLIEDYTDVDALNGRKKYVEIADRIEKKI